MTDIVLTPITSGYNLSKINANFTKVADAINNDIIHNVGGNNVMHQNLDINGFDLLNVNTNPTNPNSLLSRAAGDALYYNVSGDALAGPMDVNGQAINNLPVALTPSQPVRKAEFDAFVDLEAGRYLNTVRGEIGEVLRPLVNASSRAGKVLGFDAAGDPYALLPVSGSGTELALDLINSSNASKGASMVGWTRAALNSTVDTVHKALDMTAVSVWEYAHLIVSKPTINDPRTWDWSPAFQAAVNANAYVIAPFHDVTFLSSVAIPSGRTLVGYGCKIKFDNTSDFYPFTAIAPYTPATYFTEFLTDISIEGFTFEGSTVQNGDGWTHVMGCLAVNVRRFTFKNNKMTRCGGIWVRHAIEHSGVYDGGSSYLNAPYLNDSFWANGGNPNSTTDLNEDIYFLNNYQDTQGYYRQSCRVHFAKRINVHNNYADYGVISFWGGNPDAILDYTVLRRIVDLKVTGNHVQRNQSAIYAIMPVNFVISGNTCRYSLDVCIDVEGAVNGTICDNICQDGGNFVFGEYWYGKNVKFNGNIGIQTGAGKDLAENTSIFGGAFEISRFPNRLGNRIWSDSGVDGVTNVNGREIMTIENNGFYSSASFPVYCALNTYSWMSVKNNTFFDVLLHADYAGGLIGIPEVVGNTVFINRDMLGDPAMRVVTKSLGRAVVRDNRIVVVGSGVQTAGAYGILLQGSSTSNSLEFIVEGNEVHCVDNATELTSDIAFNITSTTAARRHLILLKNNIVRNITDIAVVGGNVYAMMEGNRDHSFNAVPSGTAPLNGGWVQGTKVPLSDITTALYEGVIAERTGFACSSSWAATTAYSVGDIRESTVSGVSRVYKCTTAGTSGTTAITGSNPTDGTCVWSFLSNRVLWRHYGLLA